MTFEALNEANVRKNNLIKTTLILLAGLVIAGCGYKAPPYYEKPAQSEEKNVAL